MKKLLLSSIAVLLLFVAGLAQSGYKKPPKEIQEILDAPSIPAVSISPGRDKIGLLEPLRYPPISELAEPMLRLAGVRINPKNNAQHRQQYSVSLTLKNISDGKEFPARLPAGTRIAAPRWSPDGRHIAFANITAGGVELWFVDTASATAKKIPNLYVNTAFGGFDWIDNQTLIVQSVPSNRGPAPEYRDVVPNEPNIQETTGRAGAVQTFQDLLRSPNDEKLFEYFATSQLVFVETNGKVRKVGSPAIFETADVSPDGKYILVSKIHRPFSYLFPASRFPKTVEVWDASGSVVHTIAEIPLQDALPVQGVPTSPRSYGWIPTESAKLIWAEALDGGDPRNKADFRDRLMVLAAPFNSKPAELLKTQHRYQGRLFGERDGLMLYFDFDRDRQRRRMFAVDYRNPSSPKLISDLNVNDRYNAIGTPVTRVLPNGGEVVRQSGDSIFLTGAGASPDGDRPFLRKLNLKTLDTVELFRSGKDEYETFLALLDDDGINFITRKESQTEPPNLFVRQYCPPERICTAMAYRQLTEFKDPTPQLRGIRKQLVRYKRADGVDLSFTLYLPPGYKEGTRLPTVVWAYPLEFTDAATAGQVSGSTNRFTQIGGYSHLFFLLRGYAVLDDATMPVVGDPLTVNDTFIDQIVASAKAAIDKGVEMGVVDPERVGVGGHSYGAFMTANLLAHSRLFRAGIARSGAYNRTLTPFGFQSERRTLWEAPDLYIKVSPFMFADKIKDPLLLIHGEADNNQGTFPIQSERMFAAIRGNGGTARLVMLPLESHGYSAKESVEHTLYEMIEWFDKWVKNASPREK